MTNLIDLLAYDVLALVGAITLISLLSFLIVEYLALPLLAEGDE